MRDGELSIDVLSQKINVNSMKATLIGDSKFEMWGSFYAGKEGDLQYQTEVHLRSDEFVSLLKMFNLNPQMPVNTVYRNFNGVAKVVGGFKEVKITPVEFILDKTKISGEVGLKRDGNKNQWLVIADVDGINLDNYLLSMPEDIRNSSINQQLLYVLSQTNSLKDIDLQCQVNLGWGIYDKLPFEKLTFEGKLKNGVWDINKLNIPNLSGASVNVSGKIDGYGDKFKFDNLKYKYVKIDKTKELSKKQKQIVKNYERIPQD